MTTNHTLRPATAADFEPVTALLRLNQLPADDIDPDLPHFFVTEHEGEITGSIGLEVFGHAALLRSMAVSAEFRNRGLAGLLVNRLLEYAAGKQVQTCYLITTTADGYFARKGFTVIDRAAVPAAVQNSREFSELCPATAVVMMRLF